MINEIILTDRDHLFSYTVINNGIGVNNLIYNLTINRILDNKYWNGTSWQVGEISIELTPRGKGNYYTFATYTSFFENGSAYFGQGLRLTHYAKDVDNVTYIDYIEDVDCGNGTPINQQTVRDSMALASLVEVQPESIDSAIALIKVDTNQLLLKVSDVDTDIANILATLTQYTPMARVVLRDNLRLLMDKLDIRKTSSIVSE